MTKDQLQLLGHITVALILLLVAVGGVQATEYTVCQSGCDYITNQDNDQQEINWAIDNATAGDIVNLTDDHYNIATSEEDVYIYTPHDGDNYLNVSILIEKGVKLRGISKTGTTLNLTDPLEADGSGDYVKGSTEVMILVNGSATGGDYDVPALDNVTISNLSLDANFYSDYRKEWGLDGDYHVTPTGIASYFVSNYTIMDLEVNTGGTGIHGHGVDDVVIKNAWLRGDVPLIIQGTGSGDVHSENGLIEDCDMSEEQGSSSSQGWAMRLEGNCDYWTLESNYVHDHAGTWNPCYSGDTYIYAYNNTIDNVKRTDCGLASHVLFENNTFKNCYRGLNLRSQGYEENATVRNNFFYDITDATIQSYGSAINVQGATVDYPEWSDVVIEGNTIHNCRRGISFQNKGNIEFTVDATINNTIITGCIDNGIWVEDDNVTGTISNDYNDVWDCNDNYYGLSAGSNSSSQDPLFNKSTSPYDFHLKSEFGRYYEGSWVNDDVTSPCIDNGTGSYSNEPDYPDGSRNLGAYGDTQFASYGGEASPTYSISGFIKDSGGSGISGADVSDNESIDSYSSDADGSYTLSGYPNGTYTITASATNYDSNSTEVVIDGADSSGNNITLTTNDPPTITWEDPTPADGATTSNTYVELNTTISDPEGENTSAFFDWNYSNVLYMPMDYYNSSHILDNSSYGNDGSIENTDTDTCIVTGKYGKAIDFDGTDDYVNVPNSDSINISGEEITVSFRFKMDNNQTWSRYLSKGLDATESFSMRSSSSGRAINWQIHNVSGSSPDIQYDDINLDEWYHVVGTYNGSMLCLYVNSTLVATQATSGLIDTTSSDLVIGAATGANDHESDIKIDEVKILDRAWSYDEVKADYNNSANRLHNNFSGLNGTFSYSAFAIDENGNLAESNLRTVTANGTVFDCSDFGSDGVADNIISVEMEGNCSRIPWALNNASVGDTIKVGAGTYVENLNITSQVTLYGDNSTGNVVLEAFNSDNHVLNVTSDGSHIYNFTVKGATNISTSGVHIEGPNNVVEGVNATANEIGFTIEPGNNNSVDNCDAVNNTVGIRVKSDSNSVNNNSVYNNSQTGLIIYSGATSNTINGNFFRNNTNYDMDVRENGNTFTEDVVGYNSAYPTIIDVPSYSGDFCVVESTSIPSEPSYHDNVTKVVNVTGVNGSAGEYLNLNITYNEGDIPDESAIELWRYGGTPPAWYESGWYSGSKILDTANNIVGANITSSSLFVPLYNTTSADEGDEDEEDEGGGGAPGNGGTEPSPTTAPIPPPSEEGFNLTLVFIAIAIVLVIAGVFVLLRED